MKHRTRQEAFSGQTVEEVEVVHPSYQPSKAELEEDMRVDATFEEAVQALAQPVRIRYVNRPRSRK